MNASAIESTGAGNGDSGDGLEKLQAILPAGSGVSEEELQKALENRRLLIVRLGIGLPLTSVIAVALSFLLHTLLAGGVLTAGWWVVSDFGRHASWASDNADGGEGFGGVIELDQSEQAGMAKGAEALLPPAPAPAGSDAAAPELKLPDLPLKPSEKNLLASDDPTLLGIGASVESPNPSPPAPAKESAPPQLIIIPPGTGNATPNAPAKSGTGDALALAPAGGTDDEPAIDLMKPGVGKGRGKGRGNGSELDRGASAVNLEPQILELGRVPDLSDELRAKLAGRKVSFEVTVGPDGRASEVKVIQSSGLPQVDAIFKDMYSRAKYRPGYDQGRAVKKTGEFGFDFTGG